MTPEPTTTITPAKAEKTPVEAVIEVEQRHEEEDFNPLGKIEDWSAFECSSGPFGDRG